MSSTGSLTLVEVLSSIPGLLLVWSRILLVGNSVEVKFVSSSNSLGIMDMDDYYYGCQVCGSSLEWLLNDSGITGFSNDSRIGRVKFSLEDRYFTILMASSMEEDSKICLTSMLQLQQTKAERPIVSCRNETFKIDINIFQSNISYPGNANGSVTINLQFAGFIVHSFTNPFTYIVQCYVQNSSLLLVDINGVQVGRFDVNSYLGEHQQHINDDMLITTAYLRGKQTTGDTPGSIHFQYNNFVAVVVVSVRSSSDRINFSCWSDKEVVMLKYPVLPATSTGSDHDSATELLHIVGFNGSEQHPNSSAEDSTDFASIPLVIGLCILGFFSIYVQNI